MTTGYITLREANKFIIEHHRHHGKVQGAILALGCFVDGVIVSVVTFGRPVSRRFDFREVCEVTRQCAAEIPLSKNSGSKLYSACARIAREMGFQRIITYTTKDEEGIALKAAGWILADENCGGENWSVPSRARATTVKNLFGEETKYPAKLKKRWEKVFQN